MRERCRSTRALEGSQLHSADAGARPGGGGWVQGQLPGRPVLEVLLEAENLALHRLLMHQLDAHEGPVLLRSQHLPVNYAP